MVNTEDILNEILERADIVKESEIPNINLYMDQVTTLMEKYLADKKRFPDDKIMTKTMINNYVKNDLMPSPDKKFYNKDHILMLIFIYYLKNILSIKDIKTLLTPISDNYYNGNSQIKIEDIYNSVCDSEKELLEDIKKDVSKKIEKSKQVFTEEKKSDKNFLQAFNLISMLSYDITIKKQIIEMIVDDMNEENEKRQMHTKNKKK
ncbi:protein of unknown function [Lachnospiraceae bacterium RM5]|nr:protein of unknown function [Lachnospiraceae bacterium RM5]